MGSPFLINKKEQDNLLLFLREELMDKCNCGHDCHCGDECQDCDNDVCVNCTCQENKQDVPESFTQENV